jgi:hypothetical protein
MRKTNHPLGSEAEEPMDFRAGLLASARRAVAAQKRLRRILGVEATN